MNEHLFAAHTPLSAKAEALRTVRSQLMLRWFNDDPARKALAVVSAQRQEGRSFIAANLAVVFSQLGKRTLLIDADLRNPVQQLWFGLAHGPGLSEILSGHGGSDLIKPVASVPDLAVLPAGNLPANAADLLARPQFPALLRDLAAQFDCIIIDTAAVAESADAQTVAACAGAALMVTLRNTSRIAQVRAAADSLVDAKATIVGTVLNEV